MAKRRYSEQEVAALLTRAAELSAPDDARGSTLDEVERIAAEAGISTAMVRQAAAELARGKKPAPSSSVWARLFGKGRIRFETVIPGEIAEEDHEELFDTIQEQLGLPGTLKTAGRAFSWALHAGPQGGRTVTVHISARNGQTTIRVEERVGNLAGGIWGGVMGGVGGGVAPLAGIGAGALIGGPVAVAGAVVATLLASAVGSRALYDHFRNRREEELSQLFESLCDAVTEMVADDVPTQPKTESALAQTKARLGLRAPNAAEEAASTAEEAEVNKVKVEEEVVS
jgi:hypothetical protein